MDSVFETYPTTCHLAEIVPPLPALSSRISSPQASVHPIFLEQDDAIQLEEMITNWLRVFPAAADTLFNHYSLGSNVLECQVWPGMLQTVLRWCKLQETRSEGKFAELYSAFGLSPVMDYEYRRHQLQLLGMVTRSLCTGGFEMLQRWLLLSPAKSSWKLLWDFIVRSGIGNLMFWRLRILNPGYDLAGFSARLSALLEQKDEKQAIALFGQVWLQWRSAELVDFSHDIALAPVGTLLLTDTAIERFLSICCSYLDAVQLPTIPRI